MTRDVILAIDQGTTNSKAVLVTRDGRVVAEASVRVPVAFPRPGWVETDPVQLWETVRAAVSACIAAAESPRVVAVAVANQRESAVAWNRETGQPLGACISWQCRRTEAFCAALHARGVDSWVRERTGLAVDPMFSGSKFRWILENVDGAQTLAARGALCLGTVDSWLVWNLTSGTTFATDATNASRTQLMALESLAWDDELLDLFGVPRAALPSIRGSSAVLGSTSDACVAAGIPVAAAVGDSHAALFGHGAPPPGAVKATYGTGTSVMAPVERVLRTESLSSTVAWSTESPSGAIEPVYALEGNITMTGGVLEWLAGILGLEGREDELESLARRSEEKGEVYLVPAFAGLGAPYWSATARGSISGLTRGTSRSDLARAALESIAFQVRDVVDVLRSVAPTKLLILLADGGAMRSDLLAQTQADLLRLPVLRARSGNLAALGAAYLAGLAVGFWGSLEEIRSLPHVQEPFEPSPGSGELEDRYRGWRAAVEHVIAQAAPATEPVEARG